MDIQLINVALIGAGARADLKKMREQPVSGENIKMNITSSLLFPNPGHVECIVRVESESSSEAVRLAFSYQGSFTLPASVDPATIDQNAISAACTAKIFPYIRECIADVTRRLPLAAPLILSPALGDEKALLAQMADKRETNEEKVQ